MTVVFVESPSPPPPLEGAHVIIFPDALSAGLAVLRASTLPEAQAATYGTETPEALGDAFPGLPYVALELIDSDTSKHPFQEIAVVQVTAWADSKAKALRLLQVARAVLVAHPGDAQVGSITAGRRGPYSGNDPDSGRPLAATSVRMRLLPESVPLP